MRERPMRRSALLSDDGIYRYTLSRRWRILRSPDIAVFVMLNPSVADAAKDDPTLRRCIAFARSWRCGALKLVNLYAMRSPFPRDLVDHQDPVGPDNLYYVRKAVESYRTKLVVAAWGAFRSKEIVPEESVVARWLREQQTHPLMCLGRTKEGFPRHPLYLPESTALEPYA